MPDLPTFTVSTTTANRLLAAFTDYSTDPETGATLTPQQAYKQWLRKNLVYFVLDRESEDDKATLETELPL